MHSECLNFIRRLKCHLPERFYGARVVEAGSYNVNGSARSEFSRGSYLGVDTRPGPGVDLVGRFHELPIPAASFDVGVTTETLEHDRHWRETLAALVRAVKPGGMVVVTCAAFGRPRHGDEFGEDGFYQNLQPEDLRPFLGSVVLYEEDRIANDLRAAWVA